MQHSQNQRRVHFSDAVIATTIMRLGLEILVPARVGALHDPALAEALRHAMPRSHGYRTSFARIGAVRASRHHNCAVRPGRTARCILGNPGFVCAVGPVPVDTGLIAETPAQGAMQIHAAQMAWDRATLTWMRGGGGSTLIWPYLKSRWLRVGPRGFDLSFVGPAGVTGSGCCQGVRAPASDSDTGPAAARLCTCACGRARLSSRPPCGAVPDGIAAGWFHRMTLRF